MAKYRFLFDTARGKIPHNVTIEEREILGEVLPGILDELRERDGTLLLGDGNPQAIHQRNILNFTQPLGDQGVLPSDEILVTCIVRNG